MTILIHPNKSILKRENLIRLIRCIIYLIPFCELLTYICDEINSDLIIWNILYKHYYFFRSIFLRNR